MANPKNGGTYTGIVERTQIIENSAGESFQFRLVLKIERIYTDKIGKKVYDYIPMRITGQKRMQQASRIKVGDCLCITGETRSESYKKNGNMVYNVYVAVDNLTWLANGRPHYSLEGDGIPAPPIDELPFG